MITLEPFTPADFAQLIAWVDNERLQYEWSGSLFSFPLTPSALTWYLEGANDFAHPEVFIYKAVDSETGRAVGHISLGGISEHNRSGRISRVLVAEGKGRGYCAAMVRALLRIGFEELHLHRIDLGVYDFNQAAIRCYKKCGLRIDGIMRDVVRHDDHYWSLVEMSILEDEWRAQQL
ncbi:GNAT family N-acetyltransferase [Hymenobacter bucti]|uniref:GNAT family N-acetyltransferase n=1 Tax=Hymenobacter bucti TaxID=1844114 RepID=A0ABW4QQT5_9BACT